MYPHSPPRWLPSPCPPPERSSARAGGSPPAQPTAGLSCERLAGCVIAWKRPRGCGCVAGRRRPVARACRSLARRAFDDAGLFRLESGHRVDNPDSCRVARAAGFSVEGIERQRLEYDGVRCDVERHARLAMDEEPAPSRSA
ncbi:GNAT family N-acetyltransferase [Streptomyces sp. NPDC088760]|uniref:GNAT family N-acetyltransferase n=1 Tax=Streptomyces sp. NPDC088760 TaxID=3365890 RepID=UPI0037F9AD7A